MSSRQSIASRQNRSRAGVPYLGVSSTHRGYLVKIAWTSAPVVKITGRKAFHMDVIECEVKKAGIRELAHHQYLIHEGDVAYFARSDDHPGYYYIVRWNGHHFVCTCPKNWFCHQQCHHQEDVNSFLLKQQEEKEAGSPASDAPRVRYGMEGDGAWQCYPYYRINGSEKQYFLDENGERVKIFGESNCASWLYLVETKSQVEADLWYQQLCAASLRESVEHGHISMENLSDEQRTLLSLAA